VELVDNRVEGFRIGGLEVAEAAVGLEGGQLVAEGLGVTAAVVTAGAGEGDR
jgi:hypothetical protein